MTSIVRRRALVPVATATLLTVGVAFAWKRDAPLDVTVHHHHFNEIRVTTNGCTVTTRLFFDAPKDGYTSRARNRNHFRFRSRIQLSDKKEIVSPIFANKAPGRRMFRFEQDTTADGCWAKEDHKIYRVDVDGCRSRACQIEAFR